MAARFRIDIVEIATSRVFGTVDIDNDFKDMMDANHGGGGRTPERVQRVLVEEVCPRVGMDLAGAWKTRGDEWMDYQLKRTGKEGADAEVRAKGLTWLEGLPDKVEE